MPENLQVKRRQELIKKLGNSIVILKSADTLYRNNDANYSYRQNSHFQYLTGFDEDESILVVAPNGVEGQSILFCKKKDPLDELWHGERLGIQKAKSELQFDEVYDIEEFDAKISEILQGHHSLYFEMHRDIKWTEKLLGVCHLSARAARKKNIPVPKNFSDVNPLVGLLRLVKDPHEISNMRESSRIANIGHRAAMAFANSEKNERDVWHYMEYLFKREGAGHVAYGSIVAGGNNANTLHYVKNNQPLIDGDLILIDAGAEFNFYASDVTRSFPVSGTYTQAQKELYEVVLAAQNEAIAIVRPGLTIKEVDKKAREVLAAGIKDLGIVSGSIEEIIKGKLFKDLYPHGTSHWLGLDVHDDCPYFDQEGKEITFEAGMVFTVEPGLYMNKNNHEIPEKYRGIGIRIEDNILVTKSGYENLSQAIPKEIKDVEEACNKSINDFL